MSLELVRQTLLHHLLLHAFLALERCVHELLVAKQLKILLCRQLLLQHFELAEVALQHGLGLHILLHVDLLMYNWRHEIPVTHDSVSHVARMGDLGRCLLKSASSLVGPLNLLALLPCGPCSFVSAVILARFLTGRRIGLVVLKEERKHSSFVEMLATKRCS